MEGLTQEQRRIREILIDKAKQAQTICYTDLVKVAKLNLDMTNPYHRALLGKLLGAISSFEHANGRPMLSSVVVSKETNSPSDGFYKLADELGYGNWRTLRKILWGFQELKRAFDYWQDSDD